MVVTGITYSITGSVSHTTPIKVTVTPAPAPTGLAAAPGLTRVKLTWTDATAGATYNLYRATTAGAEAKVQSGIAGTSFTDSNLTGGVTYFYKVSASVGSSESLLSTEAHATPTDFTLSAAPATVTVQAGTSTTASISVAPLGGFTGTVSLTGATSGITAGPEAASPASPASLPISVASTVAPNTYTLNVTSTASDALGSISHTTPITVIVIAPPLVVHVIWTSDATTSPVTQQASMGGQIGGNASVHLSLPLPPGASSPTAISVVIHEVSAPDASHDITAVNVALTGSANPLCDPPPALPSGWTAAYADIPWPLGGRNGNYTITVQGQYATAGTTPTQTQSITVDLEDLTVNAGSYPVNPNPIIWTPPLTTVDPNYVTVKAAYKTYATLTLKIYQSDQTLVRTLSIPNAANPQPFAFGGSASATPLTLVWDGNKDDGTAAGPGIYLYQFSISAPNGDSDTDKSTYLRDSAPAIQIADDGVNAVCTISYVTARTDGSAKAASTGQIDLYDPTGANLGTFTLSSLHETNPANNPNLLSPGPHTVTISIPSPQYGISDFLLSVQDNDALTDKGGRKRYALQIGEDPVSNYFVAFSHDATQTLPSPFIAAMTKLGYKPMPGFQPSYIDPVIAPIRSALQYLQKNAKPLRVLMVAGHGGPSGATSILRGNQASETDTARRDVVSTWSFYDTHPYEQHHDCYILEDTAPLASNKSSDGRYHSLPNSLSNLDLVLLIGCHQGTTVSSNTVTTLSSEFVALGAKCTVTVGSDAQLAGFVDFWLNGNTDTRYYVFPGFFALLQKNPKMTISQAQILTSNDMAAYMAGRRRAIGKFGRFSQFADVASSISGAGQNSSLTPRLR